MVENVAGVVASVVGVATDVDEEVIGANRIYASSVVVAVKLLKLTEREVARHGREVEDDGHLVRRESCMHTPYLARHCRRKLIGSLPWGIPTVVVYR